MGIQPQLKVSGLHGDKAVILALGRLRQEEFEVSWATFVRPCLQKWTKIMHIFLSSTYHISLKLRTAKSLHLGISNTEF